MQKISMYIEKWNNAINQLDITDILVQQQWDTCAFQMSTEHLPR